MVGHGLVVLLALLAAVFLAIGIVVRQRATIDVPQEHGVSAVMFLTLLRRPLWWAGTAAAVAGYVFQALALANGSLLLVQPILVSALLFALPLSARLAHRRVTRGEWAWAVVLTAALAVFVMLAKTRPGDYEASVTPSAMVALICTAAVSACVIVAIRTMGWKRAVLLAVAVGVLFGVVAMLTKLLMHLLTHDGVRAVLTTPVLYLLVVMGILAMLLQQSAFHAGSLQTSVPTMLVLEPVIAVLLGAVVLGEHLTVNRLDAVAIMVARVAMAAATIALGRDEGAYEAELEAAIASGLRTRLTRRRFRDLHRSHQRPRDEHDRHPDQRQPHPPVGLGAEVQIHRIVVCALVAFTQQSRGRSRRWSARHRRSPAARR